MSSLRAQDVKRKSRKKSMGSGGISKVAWLSVPMRIFRIPLLCASWMIKLCKSYPRASLYSCTTIAVLASIYLGTTALYDALENKLPKSITIHTNDDAISQRINRMAWQTLQEARAKKQSRTQLLSALGSRFSTIESVDSFQIRAGLDGSLQIWVTPQTPAFVLKAADGARVVISTRMLAIASLSLDAPNPNLPVVFAPEAKFSQRVPSAKDKKSHVFSVSGINLPWIFRQTTEIQRVAPQLLSQKFNLESFIWKQDTGFSVRLSKPKDPANINAGLAIVTINMGETDISTKREKLVKIVEHLSSRNIVPELVDLNFPDRAIIRMGSADTGSSVSF